ncbi:TnsA-like heteromeric transposase endonuclease subunit [Streptomyces sp. ISL-100]|uniref:TnsA-like heteromeric transposase endonuclease subunit n=1 Tax=Streptomyces sp. ISL-100 TaxID=2819173 RepID=UPI001BE5BFD5|nr:TnsA-like heteromeric transposase endonuclease subunit [Streptomyces sp. ISL-100]MBT2396781.1 TnsA-like heteromeric transposase endonuclease subunit [Streptomyces sp. ISL-100]
MSSPDASMSESGAAAWSDACRLQDLACLYTGYADYAQHLDLGEKWPVRWSTTWKFGRTPTSNPVRDLADVDILRSVPVRRFTWRTGQHHRPGLEYLVTTDRHHGFESYEEECLLLVSDFAAGLAEALSQPFRLRFYAGGREVNHTPDFLLMTESGPFLVDVRPADRIRSEDALKFAATSEIALATGWRYGVVTGWHRHVLETVDALSAERRSLTDPLGIHRQLHAALEYGPLPYGDLVDRCVLPAVARAHVLHLLWHRHLGVDLSVPFGDECLIRLAPSGHSSEEW